MRSSAAPPETGEAKIAMKGQGYYSAVSAGPQGVIEHATPMVLEALTELLLEASDAPFHFVDYGAADGGTSIGLVSKVVETIRGKTDRPIEVHYTDLPGADFETLFRRLSGERGRTYVQQFPDVYVSARGMSFYRPLVAPGTAHLGFSASAMHYLSRMPTQLRNQVHPNLGTSEEKAAFRAQGLEDYQRLLLCRAKELAPGGRLIMANFCIDEQGRYLGHTGGRNLFETYGSLWRQMHEQGLVTRAEYEAANFQQYYKSVAESLAPFQDETSHVYAAGLRLVRHRVDIVPCPFQARFRSGELSVEEHARQFVATHRSWTETVFSQALEGRPTTDRAWLIDELYQRFETTVAEAPREHKKDLLHIYLDLTKV